MLRREYAAAALLAAIIGISAWNVRKIDRLTVDIEVSVCKSRMAAEQLDFKSAREYLTDGQALWQSADTYARCFFSQDIISEASDAFYELKEHLAQEDATACLPCFDMLRAHLQGLREMEKPSVGSIF